MPTGPHVPSISLIRKVLEGVPGPLERRLLVDHQCHGPALAHLEALDVPVGRLLGKTMTW